MKLFIDTLDRASQASTAAVAAAYVEKQYEQSVIHSIFRNPVSVSIPDLLFSLAILLLFQG